MTNGKLSKSKDYIYAAHWTHLLKGPWAEEWEEISPNFHPREIASKGDGSIIVAKDALAALAKLRKLYGKPLIINSAYRDPEHNKKVKGSKNSQHVQGRAFDIHIENTEMGKKLEKLAVECGFTAIGRYKTFIHVDNREPKANGGGYRWGSW